MKILKALSKQLFGAKYEHIGRSLTACLILFFAVYMAGIKVAVAPGVLYLTAAAFSAGILWQALSSGRNADNFMGLFMLPFGNRTMAVSIVLAFTAYTLITKTFPVLALFFAVRRWNAAQIAVSLLCACSGCFMAAAAWYAMAKKKKLLPVDVYVFYRPVSAKLLIRRAGKNGSMLLYFLRYLLTNKNYLLNTAALCLIAAFLPALLGQFAGGRVMPLGFAVFCLNTPICILLSCDPDLERAVRALPGQAGRFCTQYCLFLFSVNMAVSCVYLISWQFWHGGVGCAEIIIAALFSLQSAVLSVLLEWLHPIHNWKTENDLWHHPRKYLVPLVMLLLAALAGMWTAGI